MMAKHTQCIGKTQTDERLLGLYLETIGDLADQILSADTGGSSPNQPGQSVLVEHVLGEYAVMVTANHHTEKGDKTCSPGVGIVRAPSEGDPGSWATSQLTDDGRRIVQTVGNVQQASESSPDPIPPGGFVVVLPRQGTMVAMDSRKTDVLAIGGMTRPDASEGFVDRAILAAALVVSILSKIVPVEHPARPKFWHDF